jgi:hypothetical protein
MEQRCSWGNAMSLKIRALIVTVAVLSLFEVGTAQAKAAWCQSPDHQPHEAPSDWVKLPDTVFRLVAQPRQAAAQAQLRETPVVLLDAAEAQQFLAPGEALPDGRYVFLVRAASPPYSDKADQSLLDFIKSCLDIWFSKESSQIRVVDFHLGRGDLDKDLALLVGTDQLITLHDVACLGAL